MKKKTIVLTAFLISIGIFASSESGVIERTLNLSSTPFSCTYSSRFPNNSPEIRVSEQLGMIAFVARAFIMQYNIGVEVGNLPEERQIDGFVERRLENIKRSLNPFGIGVQRTTINSLEFNNSIDGMMNPSPPRRGGYLNVKICKSE